MRVRAHISIMGKGIAIALVALLLGACVTDGAPPAPTIPLKPLSEVQGLVGPQPTMAEVPALVRKFDEMAFGGLDGETKPYIRRWAYARVSVRIDPALQARADAVDFAERTKVLEDVTGLDIVFEPYRAPREGEGGITYVQAEASRGGSFWAETFARRSSPSLLYRATAYVNERPWGPSVERAGFVEEIAQVTSGLLGDTDVVRTSMFLLADTRPYTDLTWHDAVVLRAAFDPRLRPGMSREAAMKVVPEIIGELVEGLAGHRGTAGR